MRIKNTDENSDDAKTTRASTLSPVMTERLVLNYAAPAGKPRPWFLQILVVLDPWIAIAAAIQLLFDDFSLRISTDYSQRALIGTQQWSLFAWCWRYTASDVLFYLHFAGSIILIAAVCAPSKFRRWIYWIYLGTFFLTYGLDWAASAYLETQLQGAWSSCVPQSYLPAQSTALALITWNSAAAILLIRLITPNMEFAGPHPANSSPMIPAVLVPP